MASRNLNFSRTPNPLKIYSALGFHHTANIAAAAKEHFKIPRMLCVAACLEEREDSSVWVELEGSGRDVPGTRLR
jgi:hypothetical protein